MYLRDTGRTLGAHLGKSLPGENTVRAGADTLPAPTPGHSGEQSSPQQETKQHADSRLRPAALWAGRVVLTVLVAPGQEVQVVDVVVVIA